MALNTSTTTSTTSSSSFHIPAPVMLLPQMSMSNLGSGASIIMPHGQMRSLLSRSAGSRPIIVPPARTDKPSGGPHARTVCGLIYNTKTGPLKRKEFLCNFCQFKTAQYMSFNSHLTYHIFNCHHCAFKAFTRFELINHRQTKHPEYNYELRGFEGLPIIRSADQNTTSSTAHSDSSGAADNCGGGGGEIPASTAGIADTTLTTASTSMATSSTEVAAAMAGIPPGVQPITIAPEGIDDGPIDGPIDHALPPIAATPPPVATETETEMPPLTTSTTTTTTVTTTAVEGVPAAPVTPTPATPVTIAPTSESESAETAAKVAEEPAFQNNCKFKIMRQGDSKVCNVVW